MSVLLNPIVVVVVLYVVINLAVAVASIEYGSKSDEAHSQEDYEKVWVGWQMANPFQKALAIAILGTMTVPITLLRIPQVIAAVKRDWNNADEEEER